MRDNKTRQIDRFFLIIIIILGIMVLAYSQLYEKGAHRGYNIIFYIFLFCFISVIAASIVYLIKTNKGKTPKEKARLKMLRKVILVKRKLNNKLLVFLMELKGKFVTVGLGRDEVCNDPIIKTQKAAEMLCGVLEQAKKGKRYQNAVEAFAYYKFYETRRMVDRMYAAIEEFLGQDTNGAFEENEIELLKNTIEYWSAGQDPDDSADSALATAKALAQYMKALGEAAENIYELREY